MPENTMSEKSLGMIIPIVAAWIANRYGSSSGDTPNQYPVELTPEQKRVFDEIWKTYQSGGSPIQKGVASAGLQFLGGMPTTAPGFQFTSPLLKGQPFAGGVTIPKIDFTKALTDLIPGNKAPSGTKPDGSPWTIKDIPTLTEAQRLEQGRNVFNERKGTHFANDSGMGGSGSDAQSLTTTEGGGRPPTFLEFDPVPGHTKHPWQGGPTASGLTPPRPNTQPQPVIDSRNGNTGGPMEPMGAFEKVRSAWDSFKAKHPNWASLAPQAVSAAISALTGLPVMTVEPILRKVVVPLPQPTGTFGNIPQPGVRP